MKISFKSLFGSWTETSEKAPVDMKEIEYDQHVDFYYTNIVNSLILFTYDSVKLSEMTPILIDPLAELYEELEYAFTPVCFETVFRAGRIENSLKNELLTFKKEVYEIPNEIWEYEFIDNHETWTAIKENANELLHKLGVMSRIYNDDFTTVYDSDGNILRQGKKALNHQSSRPYNKL